MIDPWTALILLGAAAVVGTLVHLRIRYLGRATLLAWLLVELGALGWYLAFGGTIFGYTALTTAMPIAMLILAIGFPFELTRRSRMRRNRSQPPGKDGFTCPHCGCVYDKELERGRCPDCGGAWDGAPGVLG